MKKLTLILLTLWLALLLVSNAKAGDIEKPIHDLFDAMREHDAAKLLAQFTSGAILQRAQADGSITTTDLTNFANSIASSSKFLDEQLLSVEIKHDGNLATVWTPFVFYVDKKLSHCGVNSFQLVNTPNGWKINYLIDNGFQGDCQDFIKQHKDVS